MVTSQPGLKPLLIGDPPKVGMLWAGISNYDLATSGGFLTFGLAVFSMLRVENNGCWRRECSEFQPSPNLDDSTVDHCVFQIGV